MRVVPREFRLLVPKNANNVFFGAFLIQKTFRIMIRPKRMQHKFCHEPVAVEAIASQLCFRCVTKV